MNSLVPRCAQTRFEKLTERVVELEKQQKQGVGDIMDKFNEEIKKVKVRRADESVFLLLPVHLHSHVPVWCIRRNFRSARNR